MTILGPFEQMYRRNLLEQQKKLQLSQNQASLADPQFLSRQSAGMSNLPQSGARPMSSNGVVPQSMSGTNSLGPFLPPANQQKPSLPTNDSHNSLTSDLDTLSQQADAIFLDQDLQGVKRKHVNDVTDSTKRVRQKTGSSYLSVQLISKHIVCF